MQDCAFAAVVEMIGRMKKEVAEMQKIAYPEQIVVAEIYNVVARVLCEACRKANLNKENCKGEGMRKSDEVSMDSFILLKQLREDNMISEEYYDKIFESLVKLKPELEEKVRKDKEAGIF